MRTEIKTPSWQYWEPSPEMVGKNEGEVLSKIFLPYSNLNWINNQRLNQDIKAALAGVIVEDTYWFERDQTENIMPGNLIGDPYWAVHHCLPVWRLQGVKQLSLLAFATKGEHNVYARGVEFPQTRLLWKNWDQNPEYNLYSPVLSKI